jgi:formyltetrahydrofolate-dependent phosphoribosylglycinamide formyltransferase
LDACSDPGYGAAVVAVGVDRPDSGAERRARAAGVPVFMVRLEDFPTRDRFDAALIAEIERCRPDLVVLAGYMKILGPAVVARFPMVNTHPSLLPSFPGAHAVREALAHGVKVTGVTVHRVDEGVDTGPILAQEPVYVRDGDTEESLRQRIQSVERGLYVRTIAEVLSSRASGRQDSAPERAGPWAPPVEAVPQGGGQTR